jgi:hypothetical protein
MGQPQRLRDMGMTVCTAAMFFWNYNNHPGEPDLGAAIVAASDRTLTDAGLGIGYEGGRFKGQVLPTKQLVLVAGDITIHSGILRLLNAELKPESITSTLQTADIVGRLLREYRMRQAAQIYLSPLNLDENTFISRQRTMDANLVVELAKQLQEYEIDAEAIMAGCDGDKEANIYRIDRTGVVACHSDINFLSIGSGGIHSSAYFMTTSYNSSTMYYRALYHTYVAKKKAEVDPYVGAHTDMFLIHRLGVTKIPDEVIEVIKKIYDENLEREKHLPEEAERQIIEAEKLLFPQPSELPAAILPPPTGSEPPVHQSTKGGRSRRQPSRA